MNFPIVKEYKLDMEGTNPENMIRGEPLQPYEGARKTVHVPRHAPFFVDTLSLSAPNGEPLILGKHYQVYKLMGRLTELAGREVSSTIEILDPELKDWKYDYHTLGDECLYDRALIMDTIAAVEDDRPVYWENLTGIPTHFPPEMHGHSLIYTIHSFQDSVDLVEEIIKYYTNKTTTPISVRLDAVYNTLTHYVNLYTRRVEDMVSRHVGSYNAHGLTSKQIQLELVNNHGTATEMQVKDASRADLLVRPQDMDTFLKEYSFNASNYLEINKIPMSLYGNRNYIPPAIDGSFEGLGSNSECTGYCLEKDGTLVLLKNHFDGRTTGLYYSIIENYNGGGETKYNFTGHRYRHPRMVSDGVVADAIAQGSDDRIILVGQNGTNNWYVGKTNGTFDFNKHVLQRVDFTDVMRILVENGQPANFQPGNDLYLAIHYYSDYVYMVVTMDAVGGADFGSGSRQFFFRVPTASLESGPTALFTHAPVSYPKLDGTPMVNQRYLRPWDRIPAPGGGALESFWKFVPKTTTEGYTAWKLLSSSYSDDTKVNDMYRTQHYMQPNYNDGAMARGIQIRPQLVYNVISTPAGITMVKKAHTPVVTLEYAKYTQEELGKLADDHTVGGENVRTNGGRSASHGYLPNGQMVIPAQRGLSTYPCDYLMYNYGKTTRKDMVGLILTKGIADTPTIISANGLIRSPLANNSKPSCMFYDKANELMNGKLQDYKSTFNNYTYREVTGAYETRPDVTNLSYPIKARPLTNKVFNTDIPIGMPFCNFTGDAAALQAGVVECGAHSFAIGMDVDYNGPPGNTQGRPRPIIYDTKKDGVFMTFPNVTEFAKDQNEMLGVYRRLDIKSYYGLSKAFIDKVYADNIPPEFLGLSKCFTIYMLDRFNVFTGRSMALIDIGWLDNTNSTGHHKLVFVELSGVEQPGGTHPNVKVFNSYLALGSVLGTVISNITGAASVIADSDLVGNMQVYKVGNVIQVGLTNPLLVQQLSGQVTPSFLVSIDMTTSVMTTTRLGVIPWYLSGGGLDYQAIPKIGMGTRLEGRESGYAALTATFGGNYYMLSSIYPESGWTIYFRTPQDVIIYGEKFTLPPGTINLQDVDNSPGNKTFYLYVEYHAGGVSYKATTDKINDTTFHLWIGKVTTSANQISNIDRMNVFLVNGVRVSEEKRGSAIPASSGIVNSLGQIAWVRDSELINN